MPQRTVSVVIASGAGGEFLFRCLSSIVPQAQALGAEVLVVDRMGPATRERISKLYPSVRTLVADGPPRASVPQLRRMGAEAARGSIVAVLEEHCTAPSGWLATVANSFEPQDAALGGPILDDGYTRLRDWCVYFSEYHNYMPPWGDVERFALNGANIAYDRAKLLAHRAVLDSGYWEVVLHPLLARDGRFRALDALGAHHTGPFDYRYYLRQRYLLSRVWGGTQKDLVSPLKRIAHLVLGPVFPLLLFARVSARVFERKRHVGRYLATLPLLAPAWVCYSFGEWLGYLVGPGDALEEVE
jgi:hypothetical protein